MKWNRQTIKIGRHRLRDGRLRRRSCSSSPSDHDGETITLGGDDPSTSAPADPAGQTGRRARHRDPATSTPRPGCPGSSRTTSRSCAQGTLALIDQGGPFPYRPGRRRRSRTARGSCPTESRGYYARVHRGRAGLGRTAGRCGSSPATAASSTGPRTTTSPSSGSSGGARERARRGPGRAPRARASTAGTRRSTSRRCGTPSSTPAGRFGYVDGWAPRPEAEFLAALGATLGFPDYYGGNLDALWDCLRRPATEPTVLLWDGWGPLARGERPTGSRALLRVLRDRAAPTRVRRSPLLLRGEGPDVDVPSLD